MLNRLKEKLRESDHPTPGPWYSDPFGNVTTHPPRTGLRFFLPTTGIVAKCQRLSAEADAKLVAAAPAMRDALEAIERANDEGTIKLTPELRSVVYNAAAKARHLSY